MTGAGRGNGAAIARGLAAAGAPVIVTDVDATMAEETAATIRAGGGDAHAFALDVTDAAACDALAARVAREIGPLRILVNNAGIYLRGGFLGPEARERWRRMLDVNIDGMFNVTMAFLDQIRSTRGAIVNMGSTNSFVAPAGSGAYPVTKGGVAQFTRALASELAAEGVRVNALAPGIIATAMTEVTRADPRTLENYLVHVPMRRVGEPEELVGPVVFLCSDAASYVTGAILPVDGGYLTS